MNENILDREWSAASLLRFVSPAIAMMLFMGCYTVVDTAFVARFVGTDALSAVNIVCPIINLTVGLATMLATGGNAIVSRKMGAGKRQEAREDFTLLIVFGAVLGFLILTAGILWMDRIIGILGASAILVPYCRDYLLVILLFTPANVLQTLFSNLFATAGRPGLGFALSALGGILNIGLDYFFMVCCGFGIRGAALGTGLGCLIPALAGLFFFGRSQGALGFTRIRWRWDTIRESCLNGSSEMVGQLAAAVTTFLFNLTMMELLGEDGVAAITILIYSQFLLNTMYIGFSIGAAPIIGFCYGNRNWTQLRKVLGICMGFLLCSSLAVFAAAFFGGFWIVGLFAAGEAKVFELAAGGFSIFSWAFLFCGLNIFTSAMFTALSNGRVSAILSFLRTFGLLAGGILVLPRFFGITGVWMAVPVAEGVMAVVSVGSLLRYWREYFCEGI